jgi:hypothetical protein
LAVVVALRLMMSRRQRFILRGRSANFHCPARGPTVPDLIAIHSTARQDNGDTSRARVPCWSWPMFHQWKHDAWDQSGFDLSSSFGGG